MQIQEHVPLGSKTTMRIGGKARYYADLLTKEDTEVAVTFAQEKGIPLIVLGGGSNTVFADDTIDALVVRIKAAATTVEGNGVTVETGKILASLINDLAKQHLDLSALTGILGTVGGAIFGNAGQGPQGVWIDAFVESVEAFVDGGWKTFSREECGFGYRESGFKSGQWSVVSGQSSPSHIPILWKVTLNIPSRPEAEVKAEVERLLKKRIETQPHLKTAGSCFKAVGTTPAWKLIDAAGLRGLTVGDVQIAPEHANFLLNIGEATYADTKAIVEKVQSSIAEPLEVEMRFIEKDGSLAF